MLPVKDVDDTEVRPAKVVEEAPKDIAVVPTVTELFCSCALDIAPCRFDDDMLPVREVAVRLLPAPKLTVVGSETVTAPATAVVPPLINTSFAVPATLVTPPFDAKDADSAKDELRA